MVSRTVVYEGLQENQAWFIIIYGSDNMTLWAPSAVSHAVLAAVFRVAYNTVMTRPVNHVVCGNKIIAVSNPYLKALLTLLKLFDI